MPQSAANFGRHHRLLSGSQFSAVFKNKKPVHGKYFSIYTRGNYQPSEAIEPVPRVGMAVSKRVSKRAVQRNRIKRQIRETFRQRKTTFGALDFVVVAKAGCAEQANDVLVKELGRLWQRIRQK